MRHYVWDNDGTRIPVSTHFRDLGCHLCLDGSGAGTTTSGRLRKATASVTEVTLLPDAQARQNQAVQSNILPAALYGIETTSGNKALISELHAAIVDAIGPRSVRRSQMGFFEIQKDGRELYSEVVQLVRRASLIRRELTKFPEITGNVRLIIKRNAEKKKARGGYAKGVDAQEDFDGSMDEDRQERPMLEAIGMESGDCLPIDPLLL